MGKGKAKLRYLMMKAVCKKENNVNKMIRRGHCGLVQGKGANSRVPKLPTCSH